jgi:hypothetical protein
MVEVFTTEDTEEIQRGMAFEKKPLVDEQGTLVREFVGA